jgi:hypothetical protein
MMYLLDHGVKENSGSDNRGSIAMLMMSCRWGARGALLALLVCVIASFGTAADSKDPAVPEADYPKLVEHQIKVLQEALKTWKEAKEPAEKKKMKEKVRCTAVMIAAIAQDTLTGKDSGARATLRDAALAVGALAKQDKVDDAAKKADELKNIKADLKSKAEKIKLFDAHIDLQELMTQFKLPKAGGQGTEAQLLKLGQDKKKIIPPASLNDALLLAAYQSAVASELTAAYVPPKDAKDWKTYSNDMRTGAIELAETVKAKNGKAAFAALSKLNTSCSVCHDKFRK